MTTIKWWYRVLYSSQLQKKRKSWSDGYMYYLVASKKAVLLDDGGRSLETHQPVDAGDLQGSRELLMTSYVVTVDGDPIAEPVFEDTKQEAPEALAPEALAVSSSTAVGSVLNAILYTKDKLKKLKSWSDGYLSCDPGLQMVLFFGEDGKVFLRQKRAVEEVREGAQIETGSYLIEVTGPLSAAPKKAVAEPAREAELVPDYDCDLPEEEPCFELMYSQDTKKKSKKWLDGHLIYTKASGLGRFYDEAGKQIFKRNLAWRQIDDQEAIATARYVFQIGSVRARPEGVKQEDAPAAASIGSKRRNPFDGPSEAISAEDSCLFMEYALHYTADVNKSKKQYAEGHLWYDGGEVKFFDEDGKMMYKTKTGSAAIYDGVEMKTRKYWITVGAEKHRHLKDPVPGVVDENCRPPAEAEMVALKSATLGPAAPESVAPEPATPEPAAPAARTPAKLGQATGRTTEQLLAFFTKSKPSAGAPGSGAI